MTNPFDPPTEQFPAVKTAQPKKWPWVLGIVAAFVVGLAAGFGTSVVGDTSNRADESFGGTYTTDAPEPVLVEPEPEPEPVLSEPEDFEIALKILSKECFGSAGCLLTYMPDVEYVGSEARDDLEDQFVLTYEVEGGEDSPQIHSLDVAGEELSYNTPEQMVQVPSSSSELTATVTDVF